MLSLQEHRNRISVAQRGTYRIICVGESTTVVGGRNSYPRQLEDILNRRDIGVKFSVINKGVIGTNTTIILSQLEDYLRTYNPDMVITMMGINDGMNMTPYDDIPTQNIMRLLRSLRTYRFAHLLRLHIANKLREIGIYKPRENPITSENSLPAPSLYNDQESLLKESIRVAPHSRQAVYDQLEWYYRTQREYDLAEEILKRALKVNAGDAHAYGKLGQFYLTQGLYDEAETMFKKAIKINPENEAPYLELLAWCYALKGEHGASKDIFKRAIEINPENVEAYFGLGWCCWHQGEYESAEEMLTKAVEIDPGNDYMRSELGRYYSFKGEYDKAEEMLQEAIQINPKNYKAYAELSWCYRRQGKYDMAAEMGKKAIEIDPENDWIYGSLGLCYKEWGNTKTAEEYFKKAEELRLEYYNAITRDNYQRLAEILTQRGIKLVCVQYPVRSVEPLKKMFHNRENIIFVDNEKVFKEALSRASYDEYFIDIFGGDFGHCTPKGNALLAENIADVILKEYFHK